LNRACRIDRMFRIKTEKNLVNPIGEVLPQAAKLKDECDG